MTSESEIYPEPKGLRDLWSSKGVVKTRYILGRIFYRLYRLLGELTAIVLGLGIALGLFIASALERQSTDISVLRPNLQIWFAEAFNGKKAEFGRLDIAWLPAREAFVITAEDVAVIDSNDEPLETFALLRATLTGDPQTLSRPKLMSAEVRGGVLSYVETADGKITIGLGPPETVGRIGPVYRNDVQTAFGRKMDMSALETILVHNATLHLRNDISGINIVANLDRLATSLSPEGVVVYTAAGEIEQPDQPARFSIGGLTNTDLSMVRTKFSLLDARPDQIAPTRGRFWESRGVAAPVDLKGEFDFSRAEGLRSASVDLNVGAGDILLLRGTEPRDFAIRDFSFRAGLEPGNDRMTIEQMDLSAPLLSFNSTGFFTQLGNLNDGDVNSSPEFDLSLRQVAFKATPTFSEDIKIKRLDVKGQADVDSRTVTIRDGRVDIFEARFDFDGELELTDDNRPAGLTFASNMTGNLGIDEMVALWPVAVVGGARRWFERSILNGRIDVLDIDLNLDQDFFETPDLTPERVQVNFAVKEVDVQYMATMPPALGLTGQGRVSGNRLTMDVAGGNIETLLLDTGRVEIPVLRPKGGDLIISGRGRGDAQNMLSVLDNEPFKFASRYGISAEDIAGTGEVEMTLTRPLLEFFPRERIDYQMQGEFTGVKAPFSFGRFNIENGDVTMDVNRERMILSGPIDIGPWRPVMRWQETFGDNPPPTQYSVEGAVTADVLDGLGIASRGWFDGTADVKVEAMGRGMNVAQASLSADLTNTALSAERIWMKPEGEPATLTGTLTRNQETGYDFRDVSLEGEGLSLRGDVSLALDYKLKALVLNALKIDGLVEGRLRADSENGKLSVALEGSVLDVSPWTQDAFQTRESGLDVPFNLTAKLDRLILDPEYAVETAEFAFSHTGEVMESARLSGQTAEGPLSLELVTLENADRRAAISVPDASRALFAFMGLSNTEGGTLRLNVDLPPAGEEGAYIGEAQMRDFRLIEAPAMAQLLSLASLTGLADTLSGGSMQFDRFTVPFTLSGDELSVRDARLYGPALGMTGDGDINLDLRVLDFDGTIVPSYTANSILGDIPVLGELFVREKDGGLFALTYTVSGPFEKTQIAVNPLSALTPGFLRRIFKPDREKVPDSVRNKIEDVAPKAVPE